MADRTLNLPPPPSRPPAGVQFARWMGTAALVLPALGFVLSMVDNRWCARSAFVFLLTLPVALIAVAAGLVSWYRIRNNSLLHGEDIARRACWKGLVSLPWLLLLAVSSPVWSLPPCGEPLNANEPAAVGSLRAINTACAAYASRYPERGYPRTIEHLGPPLSGQGPDADHAYLLDAALVKGVKAGFRFHYTAGPPDEKGIITTYSVTARPVEFGVTGSLNLYTDQTGTVRVVREDRAATAQDPPLR